MPEPFPASRSAQESEQPTSPRAPEDVSRAELMRLVSSARYLESVGGYQAACQKWNMLAELLGL